MSRSIRGVFRKGGRGAYSKKRRRGLCPQMFLPHGALPCRRGKRGDGGATWWMVGFICFYFCRWYHTARWRSDYHPFYWMAPFCVPLRSTARVSFLPISLLYAVTAWCSNSRTFDSWNMDEQSMQDRPGAVPCPLPR